MYSSCRVSIDWSCAPPAYEVLKKLGCNWLGRRQIHSSRALGSLAQRFYSMDVRKDCATRASLEIPNTCQDTELSKGGWEIWVGLLAKILPEPWSRASPI